MAYQAIISHSGIHLSSIGTFTCYQYWKRIEAIGFQDARTQGWVSDGSYHLLGSPNAHLLMNLSTWRRAGLVVVHVLSVWR
jgi:hypothetical protein